MWLLYATFNKKNRVGSVFLPTTSKFTMTQTKKLLEYFVFSLRIFAMTTCLLLFIYLMLDIFEKFSAKMTNVGVQTRSQKEDTKFLSCITACPWPAFKHHGLFYDKKLYYQETFEKEEIFADVENASVFNKSLFSIEEIQSIQMGRCYTVCHLQPVKRYVEFYLSFRKSNDIKGC